MRVEVLINVSLVGLLTAALLSPAFAVEKYTTVMDIKHVLISALGPKQTNWVNAISVKY